MEAPFAFSFSNLHPDVAESLLYPIEPIAFPLSSIGRESSECWNLSAPYSNQEKLSSLAYHARHVFIASDLYGSGNLVLGLLCPIPNQK
eukprot:7863561-Ditylum_brightwellii.AAC.1